MWQYLTSLPNILSFLIVLIGLIAIVVISLKGSAVIRWGKSLIGLGSAKTSDDQDSEKTTSTVGPPPATVSIKQPKRGCGDCILIIMGEREKYELTMRSLTNRVLKQQMNFVEQKLIDMQTLFVTAFMNQMNKERDKINEDSYEAQYKLYYGMLRDSLSDVKNEFRRSLKENGFFELNDVEFSTYVKDKTTNIVSMMSQHIRNFYPTRGAIISIDKILENIERNTSNIQEILFSIYTNAKQIILETEKEIGAMKKQYSAWVDDFIK
jgi:hypothetical protein